MAETSDRSCLGVLLAAGEGTRMRSDRPKPLHEVAGRSMLAHSLAALVAAGCDRVAVVVGPGAGGEALAAAARHEFAAAQIFVQAERRGTAHAVLAARAALEQGARRRDRALCRHAAADARDAVASARGAVGQDRRERARLRSRQPDRLRAIYRARRRARSPFASRRTPAPRSGRSGVATPARWRLRARRRSRCSTRCATTTPRANST